MPPTNDPAPAPDPDRDPNPDSDGIDISRGWLYAGTAVAVGSAAVTLLLVGPLDPSGPAVLGLLVVGSVVWGVVVTAAVFALRRRDRRTGRDADSEQDGYDGGDR